MRKKERVKLLTRTHRGGVRSVLEGYVKTTRTKYIRKNMFSNEPNRLAAC